MEDGQHTPTHRKKRGDRWFLFFILILFLAGLGIRSYSYVVQPPSSPTVLQKSTSQGGSPNAFRGEIRSKSLASQANAPDETDWARLIAPYLTEGGLSFFLGFCLGYFLRLVAKTAMLVIGAIYFGLIVLSHYGMVTVDWGGIQEVVRHLLMNAQTEIEGLRGLLTVSLPSIAMGSLGIWRGLKKS